MMRESSTGSLVRTITAGGRWRWVDAFSVVCVPSLVEFQERIVSGEPEKGSTRAKEFEKNRQLMMDIVSRVIRARRGEGGSGHLEEIPFVDSMLQNYSSEEKVSWPIQTRDLPTLVGSDHYLNLCKALKFFGTSNMKVLMAHPSGWNEVTDRQQQALYPPL